MATVSRGIKWRRGLTHGFSSIAVLVIGACLGGCGSSSNSTGSTVARSATLPTITKAQFIQLGNAVCVKGEKEVQAGYSAYASEHGLKSNQTPTKAQQAELVATIIAPKILNQIYGVEAVGAPSTEKQRVEAALGATKDALDKVRVDPELFFSSDDPFAAAGKQLHAVGLKDCAPQRS